MDFLQFFLCAGLLAVTPLLNTVWYLNIWIMYAWVYAVVASQFPLFFNELTIPLMVSVMAYQGFFLVVILSFVLLMKSKIETKRIEFWLKYVGQLNIVLSLVAIYFQERFVSGIVPNKSMNAILIVILLPFICQGSKNKLLWILSTLVIIFVSKSSSAVLSFTTMCFVWLWMTLPKGEKWVSVVSGGIVAFFAAVNPWLNNKHFFDGTGRFQGYKFFLSFMDKKDWLIGTGPATFFSTGLYIQSTHNYHLNSGVWIWLHSDPLQYIWEYGLLGLIPLAVTGYNLFKHAPRRVILALSAFIAGGLFYYDAHFPPHVAVLFLLIKLTLNNYEDIHPKQQTV